MSTTKTPVESAPSENVKKPVSYIVLKAGRPQSLHNIGLGYRSGVLMPGGAAKVFTRRRNANRAIVRSERAAARLRDSLLSDYSKLAPLLSAAPYTIVPLERIP